MGTLKRGEPPRSGRREAAAQQHNKRRDLSQRNVKNGRVKNLLLRTDKGGVTLKPETCLEILLSYVYEFAQGTLTTHTEE